MTDQSVYVLHSIPLILATGTKGSLDLRFACVTQSKFPTALI